MRHSRILVPILLFVLTTPSVLAQTSGDPNRIQGWVQVYEHDASGTAISGSLADLAAAVRAGAEVRILFKNGTYDISSDCERVWVNQTNHVVCLDLDYVGVTILDNDVDFAFVNSLYHGFYLTNTKGVQKITRWSHGQHVNDGDTTFTYPVKWLVKIH